MRLETSLYTSTYIGKVQAGPHRVVKTKTKTSFGAGETAKNHFLMWGFSRLRRQLSGMNWDGHEAPAPLYEHSAAGSWASFLMEVWPYPMALLGCARRKHETRRKNRQLRNSSRRPRPGRWARKVTL